MLQTTRWSWYNSDNMNKNMNRRWLNLFKPNNWKASLPMDDEGITPKQIFMVQPHITRAETWKKCNSLNIAHPHTKEKEHFGTELPTIQRLQNKYIVGLP